ncbi:unnamed protein product [Arabidopsis halleri]
MYKRMSCSTMSRTTSRKEIEERFELNFTFSGEDSCPATIPNYLFIPAVTSATVVLLSTLNKL